MDFYINIARFHPLLVHMPIGILVLAFMMECVNWWRKDGQLEGAIKLSLAIGTISAILSMVTGLLLAEEGGFDDNALSWHRWMGISTTVFSVLLLFGQRYKQKHKVAYRILFLLTLILLTLTGHFGGNLTHGSDYLFTSNHVQEKIIEDINQELAYETVIAPIFERKCNSCHNPTKSRGQLIMTDYQSLLAGGETGRVLDIESPDKSELLRRINLSVNDEAHMPPKGKRQVTADEVALLKWWLNNQACSDCLVSATVRDEKVDAILTSYNNAEKQMGDLVDPIDPGEITRLRNKGIQLYPVSESSPFVIVNLSNRQNIDQETMEEVDRIAENVIELNLSQSNFSDTLASFLSDFQHLKKLQLQNTPITDKTVRFLDGFEYLESLNFYGTAITDASLPKLEELPKLQSLHLWNTQMTSEGIESLKSGKNNLLVTNQVTEGVFEKSALEMPVINYEKQIFRDSMMVSLASNHKNALIFFSSSETDSFNLYEEPFYVHDDVLVKAYVQKEGWKDSRVNDVQLVKAGINDWTAELITNPSEAYQGKGDSTLRDLERGSTNFRDGNWLGYQGEHLIAELKLEKAREVSTVTVSALSDNGSWIFFPNKIEIWASKDGESYRRAGSMRIEEDPYWRTVALTKCFRIPVALENVKWLKIKATSILKNPSWHPAPGKKSWVFVDEIVLN